MIWTRFQLSDCFANPSVWMKLHSVLQPSLSRNTTFRLTKNTINATTIFISLPEILDKLFSRFFDRFVAHVR